MAARVGPRLTVIAAPNERQESSYTTTTYRGKNGKDNKAAAYIAAVFVGVLLSYGLFRTALFSILAARGSASSYRLLPVVSGLSLPHEAPLYANDDSVPPLFSDQASSASVCPQARPLVPSRHRVLDESLTKRFANETFKLEAYKALGGAVQIPTVSYEDLAPVGEDSRWDVFGELHEYLEKTFPRVYSSLNVTKINTYALVLHWQGSDEDALPVLMTAHQDVVAADPATTDDWVHPPFSGFYDGTWIWGRGSCDDKSDLIASFQAIDALLEQGFEPRRTFVWAFGIDEESSGTQGAGHLSPYLEARYGTNGFALLLDEGGSPYGKAYGGDVIFAFPALSEKGYLDVQIEVTAPGGHSSVPPRHTAIGMLSAMLVKMEDNPHPPVLSRQSSAFNATLCAAAYAPEYPADVRRLALAAVHDDAALEALKGALLDRFGAEYDTMLRTTQAADVIEGGVKVNALPERAWAIVNHRIVEHSSVAAVQERLTGLLHPLAKRYNLTMDAWGHQISGAGTGPAHLSLAVAYGYALDPSPVTPTGPEDTYQILAGTIRGAIEQSARGYNASATVVVPQIERGNTDTSRYWNLTRNIVRYSHRREGDLYNGYHTVNEAIKAEGWLDAVRFYTKIMLNCDEYL
ncbi:carboxypeptidase S [Cubamyces menziesii]|nr:carboxypeptidase S [Cubamyces menziesii]